MDDCAIRYKRGRRRKVEISGNAIFFQITISILADREPEYYALMRR